MKKTAALFLSLTTCLGFAQAPTPATSSKPRVLIIGSTEYDTVHNATGGGAVIGRFAVGSSSGTTSTTEHTETWEAIRRFMEECPAIIPTSDPNQPYDLVVKMDYQKMPANVLGVTNLYQLIAMTKDGTPISITKKNYLRREIKPTCKSIADYVSKTPGLMAAR